MADFGVGEAVAAWESWEAAAAAVAAAEAAAAASAAGAAAGGVAAAGLTAAELAAMSEIAAGTFGTAEAAGGAAAAGGLEGGMAAAQLANAGWGSTYGAANPSMLSFSPEMLSPGIEESAMLGQGAADQQLANAGFSSQYGAANPNMMQMMTEPSAELMAEPVTPYGSGDTMSIADQPGQGPGQFEALKAEALNALNKTGGAWNKIPAPARNMLASSMLTGGGGQRQAPQPARMPQGGAMPTPPVAPTYSQQAPQARSFGSRYGGSPQGQGMQGITPEMLEMLKRLQMQGRI